jgi:hypothetical protein
VSSMLILHMKTRVQQRISAYCPLTFVAYRKDQCYRCPKSAKTSYDKDARLRTEYKSVITYDTQVCSGDRAGTCSEQCLTGRGQVFASPDCVQSRLAK